VRSAGSGRQKRRGLSLLPETGVNGPPGSGRQALLRRDLALAARYGEDAENDGSSVIGRDHLCVAEGFACWPQRRDTCSSRESNT